ncbi:hypothetical protein VTP01DRAFT_7185 [Rhizomucor pusillus]|uniref:uncharacterized protein n=1 Tax=Rhizomucor pusillus TaxID=4840 RepID=UPI003743FDC6
MIDTHPHCLWSLAPMANSSHVRRSLSPPSQSRPNSAFQWPVPTSPATKEDEPDITVKQILERYRDDPDLLRHILMAKAEEDKRRTAEDTLKVEQARIQLRELDLQVIREHSRATTRYYDKLALAPPMTGVPYSATGHPSDTPYYGLAPVQQQVLARITGDNEQQRPPSPVVPYPHSAHPLCPPSSSRNHLLHPPPQQQQQQQPATPISPSEEHSRKRNRASVSNNGHDNLSHDMVMEALKAKIQRSSDGKRVRTSNNNNNHVKTSQIRQESLPSASSPSPRSAKPILPPIDTSVGRINDTSRLLHPTTSPADHALAASRNSKAASASSSTTTSSSSSSNETLSKHQQHHPPPPPPASSQATTVKSEN